MQLVSTNLPKIPKAVYIITAEIVTTTILFTVTEIPLAVVSRHLKMNRN